MSRTVAVVRALVAPLTQTRVFRRVAPHVLPVLERILARLSGGRLQVSGILVPSLVLHTVGAKSGEPRDAVLMYTPDGHGRALVAGSNFAGERHPAWSANLLAHPDATISVRGRTMHVHATLLPDDEREQAWLAIERQWPRYRGYERASGRTVRVFRLQPVRSS
ncbi:deazaflavin-dependent oxidoreductase (nitroreductase family) [Microbacterium terrae]|uniref:Deazaflavin-dependent nitroreductase n=1 Tax=Microbacterium terrae TaxID=69369 RepID=A0A0M2H272_9MICO|nr:nitroreductase family deazaflavin-dependent oxidoreductase [Microbacterium terrae]KJL37668.1 Deazaflavin-dependent nitroreductase [Microbacterium terrae]MBP1076500.1 deazaflavin-dependent oxidoreductase (nitroreductase family) [Microbacterium terrae]GLJ97329.1 hypothetical protein GCM10017594_05260 [Microbacterium terrae]